MLFGGLSLRHGEFAPVDLLVLIIRDGVDLHGHRRHHVRRLFRQDKGFECIHIDLIIRYDIGRNVFASRGIVIGGHGRVSDAVEAADDFLDLGQLDAEAAYLHLSVAAPDELHVSVGHEAHDVARVVDTAVPGIIGEGVFRERCGGLLGAVQIAPAHLGACDPKLACRADGQTLSGLVDHIQLHIVQRFADGHVPLKMLHLVKRGEDRALGGAVHIPGPDALRRKRHHFFAACREQLQLAGVFHLRKLPADLGGHERMGDAVFGKVSVQLRQIQAHLFGNNVDSTARRERWVDVVHAGVKTVACIGCDARVFIHAIGFPVPGAEGVEVSVLQHDALGYAGRAGGIEHDEEVGRLRCFECFPVVRHARDLIKHDASAGEFLRDDAAEFRRCYEQHGPGVPDHQIQALWRVGRVQRQISGARLQYAEGRNDHILAPWDQHGHDLFPADAAGAKIPGQRIGQRIQLPVAASSVLIHHSGVVRAPLCLLPEQIHHCLLRVIRCVSAVEAVQHGGSLAGQQLDIADPAGSQHLRCDLCQHVRKALHHAARVKLCAVIHRQLIAAGCFEDHNGQVKLGAPGFKGTYLESAVLRLRAAEQSRLIYKADACADTVVLCELPKGDAVVPDFFKQHLLRTLEVGRHSFLIGNLQVHRQRFDEHAHRGGKARVVPSAVDSAELHVAAAVEFGQRVRKRPEEERILRDAVLTYKALSLDAVHDFPKRQHNTAGPFFGRGVGHVADGAGICVHAVQKLSEILLCRLVALALLQCLFPYRDIEQ